ncbi:unnamed protein product [Debaryomyces fabryi]|nr:unnamed protein product [Debaryomyces fabryi]
MRGGEIWESGKREGCRRKGEGGTWKPRERKGREIKGSMAGAIAHEATQRWKKTEKWSRIWNLRRICDVECIYIVYG